MGGGDGGVIIRKVVGDALKVGVTSSGKYKLWHVLLATHLVAFVVGVLL